MLDIDLAVFALCVLDGDAGAWGEGEIATLRDLAALAGLRRAYLDLVGTLPAVSEVRDFLEDESDQKRTRVIDRLLGDPRFAAHLARTWRRVLISDANAATAFGGPLEEWLAEQFKENVTFDELARKLITAGGAEAEEEANALLEEAMP